jgi:hypothetical protein
MPLDPLLINGIRPVNVEPYGAAAARALTLGNMAQQQQLSAQQAQMNQTQIDEDARQKQIRDTVAKYTPLYTNSEGRTNHEGIAFELDKAGLGDAGAKYRGATATAAKAAADAAKAIADHAALSSMLAAVKFAPDDEKPALYRAVTTKAMREGRLKPGDMPAEYDAAAVEAEWTAALETDKVIKTYQEQRKQTEDERKNRATEAENAYGHLVTSQGQQLTAETAANTAKQTAIRDAQTANYQSGMLGVARTNAATNRGTLDVKRQELRAANPTGSNATGAEFLATLPPGVQAQVKAIAEGRQTYIPRGKSGEILMNSVNQYDPTYSVQRGQMRTAFMTGLDGRNVRALNTAVDHLDQLHEAAKAMKNGTWQPGNHLYNYIAEKFGASAPTNYAYVMNALAGETASALKGVATDNEIEHVMKTLSGDMSPAQLEGVALQGLHVMGAKLKTYHQSYKQIAPDDPWSPILPTARSIYTRYNIDPLAGPDAHGGGAAPTAAPASGGGKVISLADVKETAKNSGRSVEQVMKDARALGYEIR